MEKRPTYKVNKPEVNFYLATIGVLSLILIFYNIYIGCLFLIAFLCALFYNYRQNPLRIKAWDERMEGILSGVDGTSKQAIMNLPIPLCILEFNGDIIWYNSKFNDMMDEEELFNRNIENLVDGINLRKVLNENKEMYTDIEYKGREYTIVYNVVKENADPDDEIPKKGRYIEDEEVLKARLEDKLSKDKDSKKKLEDKLSKDKDNKKKLEVSSKNSRNDGNKENSVKYYMILYWIDRTDYLKMQKDYNDEQNVMMLIQIDGYNEVLESAKEEDRSLITIDIERALNVLETNTDCAIKKTARDKFIVTLGKAELLKLEEEKFSVLDRIREIDRGNSLPVTISIGVGMDGNSPRENLELATGAMDLALGRGGDQAVLKTTDNFIFYGGKSKAVEKKTKVKSRLIGHALRELINQSDRILVMGHQYPDMDAMGAAVGIYDICKSCEKTAHVVLDNSNEAIQIFLDRIGEQEYYDDMIINSEDAIEGCTEDTLLVVVDTHRPNHTECEQLLGISNKVVVIDHHRRGVEFIEDTVLLFHEIYVSSTCEMVTELVQYMEGNVKLKKLTAEGLLAGINLDTKNFSFKTGVRTFEAASYLKKVGADTVEVKKFFNSDVKDFIVKAQTIENAKIIDDKICIAFTEVEMPNINIVIAKVADELLNIKEVEASFVLAQKDGKVFISARSLGKINVHVLMEKLGGGGHMDIAGAQLEDVSLEEAIDMVEGIIGEFLEEDEK
ncbi:MAG: DHH family phosphoesterase [Clostridioides sp.]|jgi:c-di-AMP phosphodiesterase-like protein|nr:DHH family phosphoesterase [Clostridioides sp.]